MTSPPAERLSTADYVGAILSHSAGFAVAARDNLDAAVEHCPGWSVADLVAHLTQVHWFWSTVVAQRLTSPPDESTRPPRAAKNELVDAALAAADRLVEVLGDADQTATCCTWSTIQGDVAFVTRHQVQEAAVHHWDAEHARGGHAAIDASIAADAVDEFLAFSVSSDADPAVTPLPSLEGRFGLRASDVGDLWTLTDGGLPATVRVGRDGAAPTVEAPAADLLLWLYGRLSLDTSAVSDELLDRFRGLCFTD